MAWITEEALYQKSTASAATWGKGTVLIGSRTVKAGNFLELEIFPLVAVERGCWQEAKKQSREAQRRVNMRNAQKRLARLLNANFGPGDLLGHFTCAQGAKEEQARRQVKNFISRLRRRATKAGKKLKYVYVIETTGAEGKMKYHVHMALNGGWIDRDALEAAWGQGLARVDRCKDQPGGLKGFALYITQRKATQEKLLSRRWACSQNLRQPVVRTSYSRFRRRDMDKMAAEAADFSALAKKFPGYEIVERPEVKYSDYLPGAYITVLFKRRGA